MLIKFIPALLLTGTVFLCRCTESDKPANGNQLSDTAAQLEVSAEERSANDGKPGMHADLPGAQKMEFDIDYLTGHFDPAGHPDFTVVDAKYTDGDTYYLRKDTYDSFIKMWEAAQKDDVKLILISATRNFDRQRSIWEAKWTGSRKIENGTNAAERYPDPKTRALKILEYSSMPGTSRHHWGTDIDLNDLENTYFEKGSGKAVYEWLVENAADYGFCQPYTPKGQERPNGYNEEKWHWSYIPVAGQLTTLAKKRLTNEMISGFKGAESAVAIDVVNNYVLGINKECMP